MNQPQTNNENFVEKFLELFCQLKEDFESSRMDAKGFLIYRREELVAFVKKELPLRSVNLPEAIIEEIIKIIEEMEEELEKENRKSRKPEKKS